MKSLISLLFTFPSLQYLRKELKQSLNFAAGQGIKHHKLIGKLNAQVIITDDILDTGKTLVSCCAASGSNFLRV